MQRLSSKCKVYFKAQKHTAQRVYVCVYVCTLTVNWSETPLTVALLTLRYTNVSRRTVISGTSFECNVSYMHKYIYTIHVVWVVLAQVYSKSNCCVEPPILPSYSYVNFGQAMPFLLFCPLLSFLLFYFTLHSFSYTVCILYFTFVCFFVLALQLRKLQVQSFLASWRWQSHAASSYS